MSVCRWRGLCGGWLLVYCGALLAGFALFQFVPALKAALHEPAMAGVDERLTNIKADRTSWLIEGKGGRWGRYGWYLGSHEEGTLRIRLPVQESGTLQIRLWAYNAGALSANVIDRQRVYRMAARQLGGDVITLNIDGPSKLVVQASNESPEDQLILDRFAASWSDSRDHLPSFYPVMGALGVCLAGWGWLARTRNSPTAWRLWMGSTLIFLAVTAGWAQRWTLLEIARGLPADPDVVQYRLYAQSLQWFTPEHGFYSGTFAEREPAHIAAINLWSRLWGDTIPAIRWYSVAQSILLITVTGFFVWAVSGKWTLGTVAAWIMALNPAWIEESVRGLRIETEAALFLLVLSAWLWSRGWVGAVLLGVATGLLALLRAPMLGVVLPLAWLCWLLNIWREGKGGCLLRPSHWEWRQLSAASILAVMMFVPHLYGLYKVHGDSSWPSYGYARWNANVEFPERIGTEGFPSAEEFAKDPYAGPHLTYGEYLFGLHSIPVLVKGQVKGWLESTVYMSTSLAPHVNEYIFLLQASGAGAVWRQVTILTVLAVLLLLLLTPIGWIDLWRHPQYWWVPFLSVWGTWYAAYLYSVRLVEPFRHTAHVYPLLLFCFLWGSVKLYRGGQGGLLSGASLPWRSRAPKPVSGNAIRNCESETSRSE